MNSGWDHHQLQMENTTEKGGCRRRVDFREKFGNLLEGAVGGEGGWEPKPRVSPAQPPSRLSASPAASGGRRGKRSPRPPAPGSLSILRPLPPLALLPAPPL